MVLDWVKSDPLAVPSKCLVMEAEQWLKPALLLAHRDPILKENVIQLLSAPHITTHLEYAKIVVAELKDYAEEHNLMPVHDKIKEILDTPELGSAMGESHFHGGRELKTQEAELNGPEVEATIVEAAEGNILEETGGTENAADSIPIPMGYLAAGSGVNAARCAARNRSKMTHCPFSNEALWRNYLSICFCMPELAIKNQEPDPRPGS
jgi:hypothetical protein